SALEIAFRCKRCNNKNLWCFVNTASGCCAGCISVHAECSLFVPKEEREKVEKEKHEKRLALLRADAEVACLRAELAEVEDREKAFARRDLAVLRVQDQLEVSEAPSTTNNTCVVNSLADSG
ncbi:hypothetical protein EK21DRAFT_75508, partial [Setomelanomma holmii]